ncbi:MAG: T9SS type A sorting domain-containing protein [Bacteroidales bacterium]|nr:T9SS type A sorting domain-containing protein [Bacteroidales bacterium]
MKRAILLMQGLFFLLLRLSAQVEMKQLIIGAGGIYGNPADHVTITGFDPATSAYSSIGEVMRESIQDIFIHEGFIFVAAEDSIVKFDLETKQKVASVYESNLSRLLCHDGILYVSRRSDISGPPADGIYLKSFSMQNLQLLSQTEGISSDAAGICIIADTVYVAVPGDWQATEGKLAVTGMNLSLVREMNFGTGAAGIYDLYADGLMLFSVNKSPYLSTTGSVTAYHTETMEWSTTVYNHAFGKGVGKDGNILYLIINNGIGSIDLSSLNILEASIVPDPGSAGFIYIADAVYDHVSQLFYVTVTDYFSMGEGKIFDLSGNETGAFEADISAEAIEIEYVLNPATRERNKSWELSVWPVPFRDNLFWQSIRNIQAIAVFDRTGREVARQPGMAHEGSLDLSWLMPGFYVVHFQIDGFIKQVKVVKR